MAVIEIRRPPPSGNQQDRLRKYKIELDGHKVAEIAHSETVWLRDLTEGQHELVAQVDFVRSHPLRVDLKEQAVLEVRPMPVKGLSRVRSLLTRVGWVELVELQ